MPDTRFTSPRGRSCSTNSPAQFRGPGVTGISVRAWSSTRRPRVGDPRPATTRPAQGGGRAERAGARPAPHPSARGRVGRGSPELQDLANAVGTTRRGIGPAYADRYGRWGIRMVDLVHPADLRQQLDLLYASKSFLPNPPPRDELEAALRDVGSRLAMHVRPTEPMLWNAITEGYSILLEGAQSALLDVDFGTYPYVTSSHPTAAGALVGSGIPPSELDEVLGVAKADATGSRRSVPDGGRRGTGRVSATGGGTNGAPRPAAPSMRLARPRVAPIRFPAQWVHLLRDHQGGRARRARRDPDLYGVSDGSGETISDYPPIQASDYAKVTPIYEKFPGWPPFTSRLRERIRREGAAAVPGALKRFLRYITQETRVPVEYLSFGAARDDTLWLGRGAPTYPVTITPWTT